MRSRGIVTSQDPGRKSNAIIMTSRQRPWRSEREGGKADVVNLRMMFDELFAVYGPQHWWPGITKTEIVAGAILTQNTAWSNVRRAIANLRRERLLSFAALRDVPIARLEKLIQPSGTYRVKARRLKAFVDELWGRHHGSLKSMLEGDVDEVRRRLLSIPGIGPESADAILLYAGDRPTFVVDAYTQRILRRHFVIDECADYESVRSLFHETLPRDAKLFNEFHALFVELGKRHCRSKARCAGCPLENRPHDESL